MRVELQEVTKRFGGTLALDGVNLDVPAGSIVAVLGENGAGKSTLLRLLGAVCVADEGRILLDGAPFDRENLALRHRLMTIPDTPFLFFDRSVARSIAMHAHLYGRSLDGRAESLAALMDDMGIGALALRSAGRLSRGQIWKTALACVAAVEPELWLVDEPFASGMDALGMAAFRRLARARAAAGGTVIYTTQMVELAVDFADRVCVLREGRIVLWEASAGVRAILESPAGAEGVLKGTRAST
jgi:ABC-type multidrug transport system ATPase subunit